MQAGEFLRSLFQVIAISMALSWIAALIAAPVLGKLFLKPSKREGDPYDSFLFRCYKIFLEGCLRHRILTIIITLAAFISSLYIFTTIETSFFPDSETAYFNVDLWCQEGTSLEAQEKATQKYV